MKFTKFAVVFLISIPLISFSQIITEIMYDLEGSDTGREWIEITNNSSDSIDLSLWKFFENETNHGLTLYQGDALLAPNSSAVIVDNPDKFLADWPSFSGPIFDSSFSLKNTGELISIRNPELIDIDSVSYLPDWGGEGDGNSLNLDGDIFVPIAPSPGEYLSVEEEVQEDQEENEENQSTSSGGAFGPTVNFPVGSIKTKIIAPKIILSGASIFFESESLGVKGEKLENARHLWNFGDGSVLEGEKVLYNYVYPGEYLIFLDVNSENFTTNDKAYIKVIPSPLTISETNRDFIKLSNSSNEEINVSFWILQAGDNFFNIPKNTFIRSNGSISFPKEITGLNGNLKPLNLLYPNGSIAYEFSEIPHSPPSQNKIIQVSNSVTETEQFVEKESIAEGNTNTQVASVILAQNSFSENQETSNLSEEDESSFFNKWLLGVVIIIVLSLVSVLFIKRDNTVEGFKIIE